MRISNQKFITRLYTVLSDETILYGLIIRESRDNKNIILISSITKPDVRIIRYPHENRFLMIRFNRVWSIIDPNKKSYIQKMYTEKELFNTDMIELQAHVMHNDMIWKPIENQ